MGEQRTVNVPEGHVLLPLLLTQDVFNDLVAVVAEQMNRQPPRPGQPKDIVGQTRAQQETNAMAFVMGQIRQPVLRYRQANIQAKMVQELQDGIKIG